MPGIDDNNAGAFEVSGVSCHNGHVVNQSRRRNQRVGLIAPVGDVQVGTTCRNRVVNWQNTARELRTHVTVEPGTQPSACAASLRCTPTTPRSSSRIVMAERKKRVASSAPIHATTLASALPSPRTGPARAPGFQWRCPTRQLSIRYMMRCREHAQRSRSKSAISLLLSRLFLICSVCSSRPRITGPPAFSSTTKTLRAPMGRSSEP